MSSDRSSYLYLLSWQHAVSLILFLVITSDSSSSSVSATTSISTIAGGSPAYVDDPLGVNARFYTAQGIDFLNIEGTQLLIGDYNNAVIRHIDLSNSGATTTWAGVQGSSGLNDQLSPHTDFTTGSARFINVGQVRVLKQLDISKPNQPVVVYVINQVDNASGIRRLKYTPSDPNSYQVSTINTGELGTGGPFYFPFGLAVDRVNDVAYSYVVASDYVSGILIRITSASTTATPSVIMPVVMQGSSDDGGVGVANFGELNSITVNTIQAATLTTPDLYITDGSVIRRVTTGGSPTITTVSGGGSGYVEGIGTNAKWSAPRGIEFIPTSATTAIIYVIDEDANNVLRQIAYDVTANTYTTSYVAGTQGAGAHQDATPGKFWAPNYMAFHPPTGAMYVLEQGGTKSYVRQVSGLSPITYVPPTPASVSGDPQFVGLHGQSYQVHGTPGEVFNLITSPHLQINSLFSYLDDTRIKTATRCNKHVDTCYTHPGTYLTNLGISIWPEGQSHSTFITVTLQLNNNTDWEMYMMTDDNKSLKMNQQNTYVIKDGLLKSTNNITDSHNYIRTIDTHHFIVYVCHHLSVTFTLSPDGFFNLAVSVLQDGLLASGAHLTRISGAHDTSDPASYPFYPLHGLIGQTWKNVEYVTSTGRRYYEGMIDDYLIQDGGLLGTEFAYNQFFPSSD